MGLQGSPGPYGALPGMVAPQRGVAILGVCMCESGPAVPPDFPRTARAVPCRPVPVPCTWSRAGPGRFRSTLGAGDARPHFFSKKRQILHDGSF